MKDQKFYTSCELDGDFDCPAGQALAELQDELKRAGPLRRRARLVSMPQGRGGRLSHFLKIPRWMGFEVVAGNITLEELAFLFWFACDSGGATEDGSGLSITGDDPLSVQFGYDSAWRIVDSLQRKGYLSLGPRGYRIDDHYSWEEVDAGPTRRKSSLNKALRYKVLSQDNFTCRYCGAKAPDVALHVDHVIPVSKGGTDDELNLVTACSDCNLGKKDALPPRRRNDA